MSLSVCVRNVRVTSQGGNITEGNMTCENIDTLKSVGYTIEYLRWNQLRTRFNSFKF